MPSFDPGRLFSLGLPGPKATRDAVRLLRDTGAGGVILLARNIESPEQTRRLTQDLVDKLGRPLLFSVDHEGGWVLRFRSGLTAFPGNLALGRAGDPLLAYETGRQMALELAGLGVRLNLAPVLDVSTKVYNPGIGIRSFGTDPRLVGRLGAALTRGMQDHGVAACAKHFPGKGAATVDAHVDLPTIRLPRAAFIKTHLAPFAEAVKAGTACVMTSHVRFPAFDKVPATFSPAIISGLLRERLAFKGVIISDDLCMGAVVRKLPVAEAAVRALEAGHDMLLVCHEETLQREAVDAVRQACAEDPALRRRAEASGRRIAALDARYRGRTRRPDASRGLAVAQRTAAAAVVVRRGELPLPLVESPVVVFPDFSQVRDRFTFEGGPRAPEALVRRWLAPRRGTLVRAPVLEGSLAGVKAALKGSRPVVFFCFEARRFPGQAAALRLLNARAAGRTAACLIRSPWDAQLAEARMTLVDTAGYRLCQLERALALIGGEGS